MRHEYNSFVVFTTSCTNAPNLDGINSLLLAYESHLEQQTSTEISFILANMENVQNNFNKKKKEKRIHIKTTLMAILVLHNTLIKFR